jgi:excisionase family DNA binding protein
MLEELLTTEEVADVLRVSRFTVRRWIDRGFLKAVRIGRTIRITKSSVEHLLSQGASAPE